jgi:molybdate transport system substrate-binding protein
MIARGIAVLIGLFFSLAVANAADIKVLSSTGLKAVLEELGPQYEKATGNKLVLTTGSAASIKSQIDQGATFDVVIVTPPLMDGLAASGKIDPGTRAIIARSGLGVSLRAGAPKPDVTTPDALKQTLLNANSIGFNGQGASRAGTEAMFGKLGIADAIKPKIKLLQNSAPLSVAKGEVELALSPISEIIGVPGVELAGPVPVDYQSYLVLAGAVSATESNADSAKQLIRFLTGPSVLPVLKAKGMEPG